MDTQYRIMGLLFPSHPSASGLLQTADQGASIPWWIWALIIVGVLILLWSWLTRPKESRPSKGSQPAVPPPPASPLPLTTESREAQPVAPVAAKEAAAPIPEVPPALAAAEAAVALIPEAPPALAATEAGAAPILEAPPAAVAVPVAPVPEAAPAVVPAEEPVAPVPEAASTVVPAGDDLTVIEGIGPKVASLLAEAGIATFAQLAAADPAHLAEVLRAAHLPMIDPATWPQQARLAAAGQSDELKALQQALKGGRRVSDDLTVLEGIGPKVSSLLNAAGIATYAQLTAADPAHLTEVLRAAGLSMMDPATWPQQAALAAAGKWDDLKALTSQLKGGRRG